MTRGQWRGKMPVPDGLYVSLMYLTTGEVSAIMSMVVDKVVQEESRITFKDWPQALTCLSTSQPVQKVWVHAMGGES